MKKLLLRFVGAICILGALALMFLPNWFLIEDADRREVRALRSDISGMLGAASDAFVEQTSDDFFRSELKDYDLPHTRSSIRNRFEQYANMVDSLMEQSISLKKLLHVSLQAPGMIQDASNLSDSFCAETFYQSTAKYVLFEGTRAYTGSDQVTTQDVEKTARLLKTNSTPLIETLAEFRSCFYLAAALLILIFLLGIAATVGHICNKGRWLKYLFLVIQLALVAGSCIAIPMVAELLTDTASTLPAFADASLKITSTPFLAIGLLIIPILLDITCERKIEKKKTEEVQHG